MAGPFRRCPFEVAIEAEANFGGVIIPSRFSPPDGGGYGRQAKGEFFRAQVIGAQFG